MNNKELNEVLDAVENEETLIAFMLALAEDRAEAVEAERAHPSSPYGPDAGGWENTTIDSYLKAAASWAEDSNFGTRSPLLEFIPESNVWKRFALCLYCGKIYELADIME